MMMQRFLAKIFDYLIGRLTPRVFYVSNNLHKKLGSPDANTTYVYQFIVAKLAEKGIYYLTATVEDIFVSGEDIGDWKVIVERVRAPRKDAI